MKRISVVILNWNGREMMRRFLPSVVACSADEADVVVADNASTDGSCAMLAAEFPGVRVLRLDRNYGFAGGYNRALACLTTDYYLLLNSDVEATPGWLAPLLRYMDGHPEVAACQPKLLSAARRDTFEYAGAAGGYIDRYGYPFCRGRIMDTVERDRGQYDRPASVFWASGAALMVRRTDWDAVGGLDGRFFAHMEEVDLCWRLKARGRAVVCLPESRVYHVGGGTLGKSDARKTYLNFRNNLLMLYKNLPAGELDGVMRVRRVLDYAALVRFALSGHMEDARAVLRARKEFKKIRPDFEADRRANLGLATASAIPERARGSILWAYYVLRRRTFARLVRGRSFRVGD